jgi:hypothetical protein
MLCKICGTPVNKAFSAEVLGKYSADYYHCEHCGFLGVAPATWLAEAYQESINKSDTGYLARNISLRRRVLFLFLYLFGAKPNYLDYAGGYGTFTRLMRDYGLNYFWDDKYTSNIFAAGFEYHRQEIKALTCFECFEHLDQPLEEIAKMLKISRNILFSTTLIGDQDLPDLAWPYYGFSHGQHIAFYSRRTLEYLAAKHNLYFYSDGSSFHFFSEHQISPQVFKLILKLSILPWNILMGSWLRSKTLDDSQMIIKKTGASK